MTMNDPNPKYSTRDRRQGISGTAWTILGLVAILAIAGIMYAFSTGDQNHTTAVNQPTTTTGTGINKTPLNSTSPVATAPPSTTPAPTQSPADSGGRRP